MAKTAKPNILTICLTGLLAWVIPGAGHVFLGRTVRGIIICICINGLFWAGVAFGGVFTVEPLRQKWWFAAQMCTGVSGAAGWVRQERYRTDITKNFADRDLRTPTPPRRGLGRRELAAKWWTAYNEALAAKRVNLNYPADTVARAYSGVAGMLNLMCIFDAVLLAAMGVFGEPPPETKPKGEEVAA